MKRIASPIATGCRIGRSAASLRECPLVTAATLNREVTEPYTCHANIEPSSSSVGSPSVKALGRLRSEKVTGLGPKVTLRGSEGLVGYSES